MRPRITARTDFFHVGGSSLLLLSFQAHIEETFHCEMPLVRMFESSTLSAMAQPIDQGLSYDVEADAIDWVKETALPLDLLHIETKTVHSSTHTSPKLNSKPRVVALTGAIGQLGRALLD